MVSAPPGGTAPPVSCSAPGTPSGSPGVGGSGGGGIRGREPRGRGIRGWGGSWGGRGAPAWGFRPRPRPALSPRGSPAGLLPEGTTALCLVWGSQSAGAAGAGTQGLGVEEALGGDGGDARTGRRQPRPSAPPMPRPRCMLATPCPCYAPCHAPQELPQAPPPAHLLGLAAPASWLPGHPRRDVKASVLGSGHARPVPPSREARAGQLGRSLGRPQRARSRWRSPWDLLELV